MTARMSKNPKGPKAENIASTEIEQGSERDVVIALDAGTTSVRAIAYTSQGEKCAWAQHPVSQYYPQDGWVEHDAEEIVAIASRVIQDVLREVKGRRVRSLGITNQRETVVLWERASGRPLHHAIVWQDRRTADVCNALREGGVDVEIAKRTGLLIDPYFSATKIAWLLDHVEGARQRAERGELLVGTIDTWLVWKLTNGRVHATDFTNACRTLLCDIRTGTWDKELCKRFGVPIKLLPKIMPSIGDFGSVDPHFLPEALPITCVLGDQQAAAIGQGCMTAGMAKATFGTGCFVLLNTGKKRVSSEHRLLTTVALGQAKNASTYALEGSVFNAGTVIQWMRDDLGLLKTAAESAVMAASVADTAGVYVVPAFTGLGAPWWDAAARGLICGLTRATSKAHMVRAGLESVAYQAQDLCEAMVGDGATLHSLRIDGGMAANDWFCQFLADQLQIPVERPVDIETTVRGAALGAAVGSGLLKDLKSAAQDWWTLERQFTPAAQAPHQQRHAGWIQAVHRAGSDQA